MDREKKLAQTFVELVDTLVDDYDLGEYLHLLTYRCADLVDAGAVGVLLTDAEGNLQVASASTEDMHALELFEMQNEEGPCYDAFRSGEQVVEHDLGGAERWSRFTPKARELGFRSVHAFPLRVREERMGALNVFFFETGPFSEADVLALQALADVAAIAILRQRSVQEVTDVAGQLQIALDSRVVIEQAVGVLVARLGTGTREAFEVMRRYARDNNKRLHDVAQDIVDGAVPPETLEADQR